MVNLQGPKYLPGTDLTVYFEKVSVSPHNQFKKIIQVTLGMLMIQLNTPLLLTTDLKPVLKVSIEC